MPGLNSEEGDVGPYVTYVTHVTYVTACTPRKETSWFFG